MSPMEEKRIIKIFIYDFIFNETPEKYEYNSLF
jgi:hypothetical protein